MPSTTGRRESAKRHSRTRPPEPTSTPASLELVRDLHEGDVIGELQRGPLRAEVVLGQAAIWAVQRFPGVRSGGLALKLAECPGGCDNVSVRELSDRHLRISARSPAGRHQCDLESTEEPSQVMCWSSQLTPSGSIRMPIRSRDLFPLGRGDDPRRAQGRAEAAQRGLNTALLFFHLTQPDVGSLLYLQDLTALNGFFSAAGMTPEAVVGGEWPELGFLPSAALQGGMTEGKPLPAGLPLVVSQGILACLPGRSNDPHTSAQAFLRLLAAAYPHLVKAPPQFHDWPSLARRTVRDLAKSPDVATTVRRRRYIRPYTAAEIPDAMVQASLASEVSAFEDWEGSKRTLGAELAKGMPAFFDPHLGTIRRYLPGPQGEKDINKVDSWYLYHPLMSLGRLALHGDRTARTLFEDSLDYAVRVAQHFDYRWPIMFNVNNLGVIEKSRGDAGFGQTDVNGIYAYVMLQAYEVLEDTGYVDEAVKAIAASMAARFELNYQSNITALGAAACVRLWRITADDHHLAQAYTYLASFFHNTRIWESRLTKIRELRTFLTSTCLHDAAYTAAYETFDSFVAFEELTRTAGREIDPAAQLLISEFCAYALDTTWWAYPGNLPADCLAPEQRNGHIDRRLAFPLEDMYVDTTPPGHVGQEVYGGAAALVFSAQRFHKHPTAPFTVFCDRTVAHSIVDAADSWALQLNAPPTTTGLIALLPKARGRRDGIVVTADGERIRASRRTPDRVEYCVPGGATVHLHWKTPTAD